MAFGRERTVETRKRRTRVRNVPERNRAQRRFSSGIGHRLTKVTAVKLDARETAAVAITDLRKRATCKIGRMPNAIPGRFRARIPLHSGDFCDSAKGFPVKHGQQTGEAASGFRRPSSTLRWLQPERNVTARSGPFLMESIERTEARSHAVFKRRAQWKAASHRAPPETTAARPRTGRRCRFASRASDDAPACR